MCKYQVVDLEVYACFLQFHLFLEFNEIKTFYRYFIKYRYYYVWTMEQAPEEEVYLAVQDAILNWYKFSNVFKFIKLRQGVSQVQHNSNKLRI